MSGKFDIVFLNKHCTAGSHIFNLIQNSQACHTLENAKTFKMSKMDNEN